jgi:hypothetical protein
MPHRSIAVGERNLLVRLIAERGLGASLLIGVVFWNLSGELIAVAAMVLLWAFWRFLPIDEGPPGLPFSCSFHLAQIVIGVFYFGVTNRDLQPMLASQYERMMWLAVLSLAAIAGGFLMGNHFLRRHRPPPPRVALEISTKHMLMAYVATVLGYDTIFRFAFEVPLFTEAVLALLTVQNGLLYLILRRLFLANRPYLAVALVLIEVARGFTGFYSEFKDPVLLAMVAAVEVFRPRRPAQWLLLASLVVVSIMLGTVWIGIRSAIREDMSTGIPRPRVERLTFAIELAREWWDSEAEVKMYDLDDLVERMWDIYYTALALDRVPTLLPHENGEIMWRAVQHVLMPRFLFPDKPPLPSESEEVYRYTGLKVAGRESNTTIAFGSVIQSYIDFGVPGMFVPPLLLGIFLGAIYRWLLNNVHHDEILLALVAVGFWSTLMPFNMTWAKILGKFLTALVYVGGAAVLLDKLLYDRRVRRLAGVSYAEQPAETP